MAATREVLEHVDMGTADGDRAMACYVIPKDADEADARVAPLSVLQRRCFDQAEAKGWHSLPIGIVERLCLIHSEVSEVLEEVRGHRPATAIYSMGRHGETLAWGMDMLECPGLDDKLLKPEGVPIELADAVIRILDLCAIERIDLASAIEAKLRYNLTRGMLHGGKAL